MVACRRPRGGHGRFSEPFDLNFAMAEKRKLAAIVAADVVGFSRLASSDESTRSDGKGSSRRLWWREYNINQRCRRPARR
jgi:hypothetical protein